MKNFRALDYANIKKGSFFRSESLFNISKEDQKLLIKSGVKIVIDLRAEKEREAQKDVNLPNVNNINIPLNADKGMKTIYKMDLALPDLEDCYEQLVNKDRKDAWSKIFDVILNNNGGILIHCTSGKDRSGIVSAVILKALGVDKETIFNDYLLTNQIPDISLSNNPFVASLDEERRKLIFDHFSAKKEYLEASFNYINKEYGSFENFLKENCSVNNNLLKEFRNKYLD